MRYYLKPSSLIIRGSFRACSSGHEGGIRDCTTILNHQVIPGFIGDPDRLVENLIMSQGFLKKSALCLLTAVCMDNLCILSSDPVMVFVTAGITHPDSGCGDMTSQNPEPGTINIIVISRDFSDQGLVDAIITATEAKVLALRQTGYPFAGTVTDAVLVATEGRGSVRYAGSATEIGRKIHDAVFFGVCEALKKPYISDPCTKPSFYIRSSMGGDHWVLWEKTNCPYYPCHYPGQSCNFCYCPLYPCGDTGLGEWIEKDGKQSVWGCTRCTLNHNPVVVRHLLRNPEASLVELKSLSSTL